MSPTDPKGKWAIYSSHLGGYMRRWILRTPWFTLRIHNILTSDAGRDFHDHPFDFVSVIFRGGYIEHRPGCWCRYNVTTAPCQYFGPSTIVRRRAEDLHRLELVNGPAWTFVISSNYRRDWGFQLQDGSWVPFQKYPRSYYEVRE